MKREDELVVVHHILADFASMPDNLVRNPCDESEQPKFTRFLKSIGADGEVVKGWTTNDICSRIAEYLKGTKWTLCAILEVRSRLPFQGATLVLAYPIWVFGGMTYAAPPELAIRKLREKLALAAEEMGQQELLHRQREERECGS